MRQAGWSLRRLAQASGVDRAGLRRLRKGHTQPSWSVACAVADALGVALSQFVGRARQRRNSAVRPDGQIDSEET